MSPVSPALAGGFFTTEPLEKSNNVLSYNSYYFYAHCGVEGTVWT